MRGRRKGFRPALEGSLRGCVNVGEMPSSAFGTFSRGEKGVGAFSGVSCFEEGDNFLAVGGGGGGVDDHVEVGAAVDGEGGELHGQLANLRVLEFLGAARVADDVFVLPEG